MISVQKVCPVVTRASNHGLEVLAFRHPSAGCQFVKGTIKEGELPRDAASRELFEESGLICSVEMAALGTMDIGPERTTWHFFIWGSTGLPERWEHSTEDDCRHTFAFFWHPIGVPLDEDWHPIFREAFQFVCSHFDDR
ncbi:NUDIX domain-containing protein [Agrobacterium rubi]|uniref:NUDIX domain-containing protein n=1 Tax=Agrobacterium rubi TaxID=28099 RepID=UPI0015732BBE|nr:NUDIX domain-containing protein [Agrobacterium rubi]NTF19197.1 NUDIX domain-containing protein [Agrobacterium rubi]NTF26160.1 NUDIX domain-containing protein [Agrobacterium rubi]